MRLLAVCCLLLMLLFSAFGFSQEPPPAVADIPPGGVLWDKMPPAGGDHYELGGSPASRRAVFAAMTGADTLTDDSKLPWVTVITASDDERRAIIKDFRENPALTPIRCRLKGYPAGHAAVADFPPGLIHLQAANGRPLKVFTRYDGPDRLGADIEQALAGYDPANDPGPGKPYPKPAPPVPAPQPQPPGVGGWNPLLVVAWIGYGIAALCVVVIVVMVMRSRP